MERIELAGRRRCPAAVVPGNLSFERSGKRRDRNGARRRVFSGEAVGNCWTAGKDDYHLGNTLNHFGLEVCDPQLSAYDAARMMNSLVLINAGRPRPSEFDKAQQSFVLWALVSSGSGPRLDAVDYPHQNPCEQWRSNSYTSLQQNLMARVTDYYDDWNFGNLNAAYALLSAKYQAAHNRGAWLREHGAEKAIGLSDACAMPNARVGATIEWVDR